MKLSALLAATTLLLSCSHAPQAKPPGVYDSGIVYPTSAQVEHIDTYHGVEVADPYRWLEDLDSPDTARWVKSQNALTHAYLDQIPQATARAK